MLEQTVVLFLVPYHLEDARTDKQKHMFQRLWPRFHLFGRPVQLWHQGLESLGISVSRGQVDSLHKVFQIDASKKALLVTFSADWENLLGGNTDSNGLKPTVFYTVCLHFVETSRKTVGCTRRCETQKTWRKDRGRGKSHRVHGATLLFWVAPVPSAGSKTWKRELKLNFVLSNCWSHYQPRHAHHSTLKHSCRTGMI